MGASRMSVDEEIRGLYELNYSQIEIARRLHLPRVQVQRRLKRMRAA